MSSVRYYYNLKEEKCYLNRPRKRGQKKEDAQIRKFSIISDTYTDIPFVRLE